MRRLGNSAMSAVGVATGSNPARASQPAPTKTTNRVATVTAAAYPNRRYVPDGAAASNNPRDHSNKDTQTIGERKRVVSGKSGEVRVALGGRRISKKKKKKSKTQT